jgi:hypothetical protein
MDELIFTSKTMNNCMKIKKAFEKLKIKANFEYHSYIKCITPHNCYLEKAVLLLQVNTVLVKKGKNILKIFTIIQKLILTKHITYL